MSLQFKRLTQVNQQAIIDLMNNPLVRRQMPLLQGEFTEADCDKFVAAKEALWEAHGYGPWVFTEGNVFAGWGGLQYEAGEADLALVLHPDYWGHGKELYRLIIEKAFNELGIESIQVLFPPSRTRVQGLLRLGFQQETELEIGGETFIRYRLNKPID